MEHKLSIQCPNFEIAAMVEELFIGLGYGTGFEDADYKQENWIVNVFFKEKPDMNAMNARVLAIKEAFGDVFDITLQQIDSIDWVAQNQKSFKPLDVAEFFLYQSLYTGEIPKNKTPILVEATRAFGTGSHGTTAGCLTAISDLKKSGPEFKNIIDIGTGTGILAIACRYVFADSTILATDIDIEAVEVTHETLKANSIDDISALHAEGVHSDSIVGQAPYDLIVANILCEPLVNMAPEIYVLQKIGGVLIVSGMLDEQEKEMRTAYEPLGYALANQYPIDHWQTLVFKKVI